MRAGATSVVEVWLKKSVSSDVDWVCKLLVRSSRATLHATCINVVRVGILDAGLDAVQQLLAIWKGLATTSLAPIDEDEASSWELVGHVSSLSEFELTQLGASCAALNLRDHVWQSVRLPPEVLNFVIILPAVAAWQIAIDELSSGNNTGPHGAKTLAPHVSSCNTNQAHFSSSA